MDIYKVILILFLIITVFFVFSFAMGVNPFCRHYAYTRGGRICLDEAKYR